MQDFVMWLWNHYIEVLATLLGMLYVVLSVKQNIWTWPVGLLCSILYIYVYLDAKFYADMALQVYYVAVSIYGWVQWLKGSQDSPGEKESKLMVSKTPHQMCWYLVVISLLLFVFIYFILNNYTDSPVPVGDAITTALSVVATWMLAKNI